MDVLGGVGGEVLSGVKIYYESELLKPFKPHLSDAGWDLRSKGAFSVEPLSTVVIPTGVSLELDSGLVGLVKCRSSLGKRGVSITSGVIDAGYRGEIGVVFQNLSTSDIITIQQYERIAQLLILPIIWSNVRLELGKADLGTSRGEGGFGSSGME